MAARRSMSRSSWTATAAGPGARLPRPPGIAPASSRCAGSSRNAPAHGVRFLTLFAFSSENWRRPPTRSDADVSCSSNRWCAKSRNCTAIRCAALHRRSRALGASSRGAWRRRDAHAAIPGLTLSWRSPTAAAGTSRRPAARWPRMRRPGSQPRHRRGALRRAAGARRHPIRTCSSAPAASSASAISCCGIWPTPSCISPTCCGRISRRASGRGVRLLRAARAALRQDVGAARAKAMLETDA
jgi:hypothetical protein